MAFLFWYLLCDLLKIDPIRISALASPAVIV
jgi:hypothetical protein